jgi:hypothetical protein
MTDKEIIDEARELFKISSEAEEKMRQSWIDDVRFARLGKQWPDEVEKQRLSEGRPCLTVNRLPSFIRQVTNDARQNKPAIKVSAAGGGADAETARIISGLIKNIEYSSGADVAYMTALDHAVTGGYGYIRVCTDYSSDDGFDQDIRIERIVNPLNVYGDPYSTAPDSSDWNVAFVTELLKESEFKKKYPNASTSGFTDGDRDEEWFADGKVRVAEYWLREDVEKTLLKLSDGSTMYEDKYEEMQDILQIQGVTVLESRTVTSKKVTQRIITGSEILETNKWAGKYIPIIPVYGDEVNAEGERSFISLIRPAIDVQRMFNYWRSASTELVALAPKTPFIGPKGAFNSDAEKWATANVKSHPYIEFDGPVQPQRQPFAGVPAGVVQEAMNASDDMKSILGIFDASLGQRSNETSGKAILARQREGDVSTFNFIDNLSRAIRHLGIVIVDLIPAVYSVPRVVRAMWEDGTSEDVQINQPHPASPPPDAPVGASQIKKQQEFLQGIIKIYDLTTGKYDVVCESGPSYSTQRQEASAQMMMMVQSYPDIAPIIGDLIAKNMDWPGADEISERLKAMLPPQLKGEQQLPPEAQQMIQQMQQQLQQMQQVIQQGSQQIQKIEAENGGLKSQLASKQTEKEIKQIEASIKMQELELKKEELQCKGDELSLRKGEAMAQGIPVDGSPLAEMITRISLLAQKLSETQAIMAQPKTKTMNIKAPSGQVYQGTVVEQ